MEKSKNLKESQSYLEYGEAYLIRVERPITVRVAEVRNLPKGVSGTWVELLIENRHAGKTLTKFKEKNPFFGEDITFTLNDYELEMTAILWKESVKKGVKKNSQLGRVKINLDEVSAGDNWFTLENLKKGVKVPMDIRISIIYNEIAVLPTEKYSNFLKMLMDKSSEFKIVMLLSTTGAFKSKEAAELAELLVQIGDGYGQFTPEIISCLVAHDIKTADCKETLFRGNSVGTKALDYYMKWVGVRWLDCVKPLIQTINISERNCEIRDSKLRPEDNWKDNLKNLTEFFQATTSLIFASVHQCPLELRRIFHFIRKEVSKVFTDDPEVEYTAITGFLFLRFFVPAIMTPKLFGLADDYSTGNTERTFTLIATVLQKLANFQIFEPHEAHFDQINPILELEKANMKQFVDILSTTEIPIDEEAIHINNNVDLDLMVARLCHHISAHQKVLEDALPDKGIVVFLGELQLLFDEMKFLLKKFKKDQEKKRKQMDFTQSAPSTPNVHVDKMDRFRSPFKQEIVKRRHSFSLERLSLTKNKDKEKYRNGCATDPEESQDEGDQ